MMTPKPFRELYEKSINRRPGMPYVQIERALDLLLEFVRASVNEKGQFENPQLYQVYQKWMAWK